MAFASSRWGDEAGSDDDEQYGDMLPDVQVFGPDSKGIKTVIEYKQREDGVKVKVTQKIRVSKKLKKVSKAVAARKVLPKFGAAVGERANDNISAVSVEQIFLEKPSADMSKKKKEAGDPLAAFANQNASLLVCRICGKKGDHWTSKCPYKSLAAAKGLQTGEKPPEEGDDVPSKPSAGGYVPPSMRAGAGGGASGGESMRRVRDENSVRVTNLSEDTQERDLQELFRPFGQISRTYIAYDRDTGESRGFAFINFANREDAQRAINKLDGYGYDNLILRVEWAAPRADHG
mmetsp:Transcript_26586/g.32247  ORF Transcript_26586/g.32247 Transcript_26586/m.32247 type:complete len:290 (-) Transcript_26586:482-1351(-)|eukprot:CAMPEP_0197849778 /NCGR_PEP_ID=MMETSP1438-20131217/13185_1 /TAXON_ID=1461541 /ORGANISM="Pterosperma sp., Strain CCMP1384" /LENGTH=289 /DNA_ID=CAMNT_0043462617 /DNA_START=93 /DNA_END=962 /DNA_ORIENTATION=+